MNKYRQIDPLVSRRFNPRLKAQFGSTHNTEHQMMECLTESLWLAQRNNLPPSEEAYLAALHNLLKD